MPLSVGDRLGPYEILAPIGVGGSLTFGLTARQAVQPKLQRELLPLSLSREALLGPFLSSI